MVNFVLPMYSEGFFSEAKSLILGVIRILTNFVFRF